jgi:hypothetical protein
MLHDALFEFSASVAQAAAAEAGITTFRYEGDTIETTRPFCEKHVGKEYTTDEIYEIWDDSGRQTLWRPVPCKRRLQLSALVGACPD